MKPEFLFFIYAFPALDGCCGMGSKERDGYLEMILRGEAPAAGKIEEMLPAAAMRMEEIYGENFWEVDNVRDYWWTGHNKIIDSGKMEYAEASIEQKNNCKVRFWEVENYGKNGIVELRNKYEVVEKAFNYRNLDLVKGAYVTTHKGHVIEEISFEDFEKYG